MACCAAAATACRLHLLGDPLQKPRPRSTTWPSWGRSNALADHAEGLTALQVPTCTCALGQSYRVRPMVAQFLRQLLPSHCQAMTRAKSPGRNDSLHFVAYSNDQWWVGICEKNIKLNIVEASFIMVLVLFCQ